MSFYSNNAAAGASSASGAGPPNPFGGGQPLTTPYGRARFPCTRCVMLNMECTMTMPECLSCVRNLCRCSFQDPNTQTEGIGMSVRGTPLPTAVNVPDWLQPSWQPQHQGQRLQHQRTNEWTVRQPAHMPVHMSLPVPEARGLPLPPPAFPPPSYPPPPPPNNPSNDTRPPNGGNTAPPSSPPPGQWVSVPLPSSDVPQQPVNIARPPQSTRPSLSSEVGSPPKRARRTLSQPSSVGSSSLTEPDRPHIILPPPHPTMAPRRRSRPCTLPLPAPTPRPADTAITRAFTPAPSTRRPATMGMPTPAPRPGTAPLTRISTAPTSAAGRVMTAEAMLALASARRDAAKHTPSPPIRRVMTVEAMSTPSFTTGRADTAPGERSPDTGWVLLPEEGMRTTSPAPSWDFAAEAEYIPSPVAQQVLAASTGPAPSSTTTQATTTQVVHTTAPAAGQVLTAEALSAPSSSVTQQATAAPMGPAPASTTTHATTTQVVHTPAPAAGQVMTPPQAMPTSPAAASVVTAGTAAAATTSGPSTPLPYWSLPPPEQHENARAGYGTRIYLDVFFAEINRQFPFLDGQRVLDIFNEMEGDAILDLHAGSEYDTTLIYLIMAIGNAILIDSDQLPAACERHSFSISYKEVVDLCLRDINNQTVEILVLLSLHSILRPYMYHSCQIIDIAARQVTRLGLAQLGAQGAGHGSPEAERNYRLFWITFVLDRMASAASGIPACLDDTNCTITLPSVSHLQLSSASRLAHASLLQVARYLIELSQVEGKVLREVLLHPYKETNDLSMHDRKTIVMNLRTSIDDWYNKGTLLRTCQSNNDVDCLQFDWMAARYWNLMLTLHFPSHFNPAARLMPKGQLLALAQKYIQATGVRFARRELPLNHVTLCRLIPSCMVFLRYCLWLGDKRVGVETNIVHEEIQVCSKIMMAYPSNWRVAHYASALVQQFIAPHEGEIPARVYRLRTEALAPRESSTPADATVEEVTAPPPKLNPLRTATMLDLIRPMFLEVAMKTLGPRSAFCQMDHWGFDGNVETSPQTFLMEHSTIGGFQPLQMPEGLSPFASPTLHPAAYAPEMVWPNRRQGNGKRQRNDRAPRRRGFVDLL